MTFWIEYFTDWVQGELGCSRDDAVARSTLLLALLSGLVMDLECTNDVDRIKASLDVYLASWA